MDINITLDMNHVCNLYNNCLHTRRIINKIQKYAILWQQYPDYVKKNDNMILNKFGRGVVRVVPNTKYNLPPKINIRSNDKNRYEVDRQD